MSKEYPTVQEHHVTENEADQSCNLDSAVSAVSREDNESQASGEELSTIRLVLVLGGLWVSKNYLN